LNFDGKIIFLLHNIYFYVNGMSSIGYLGRFFETARTAW
jgi:hypothetical protein